MNMRTLQRLPLGGRVFPAIVLFVAISGCGAGGSTDATSATTLAQSSEDGVLIEIAEGADETQDGYEECAVYPTPCGAELVQGAEEPEDEYAKSEDPADFLPNVVTVGVGETVTWKNLDQVIHTVTAVDGSFDSGDMFKNGEFEFTFDQAGEYSVFCVPHPWMRAKIVVEG